MAEIYQVDQYRYTGGTGGKNPCVEKLNTYPTADEDKSKKLEPVYRDAEMKMDDKKTACYQDVLIPLFPDEGEVLDPKTSYYIDLQIANTGSTDTDYILKLVSSKESGKNYPNYEVVKRFTVPANGWAENGPVRVVLYSTVEETTDGTLNGDPRSTDSFRIAVIDKEDRFNNISIPEITEEELKNKLFYNEVQILPTWIFDVDDNKKYHYSTSISSSYYEKVFDSLLLEIERKEIDKDIVTPVDKEKIGYDYILGRWLNVSEPEPEIPDHLDVKLYSITNLLEDFKPKRIIKKIGVWGRPGLPLIINGSEIQIGPSGVFEFEGIDITSFGVFANGPEDKFVVDYQYVVTE